jgi:hypothetical protein
MLLLTLRSVPRTSLRYLLSFRLTIHALVFLHQHRIVRTLLSSAESFGTGFGDRRTYALEVCIFSLRVLIPSCLLFSRSAIPEEVLKAFVVEFCNDCS